ncbi:allene oxide cyclase barrel-like domain-containing protein [Streptomyces sp. NPDC001450]
MRHINRLGLSATAGLAAALCCAPLASAAAPATGSQPTGNNEQVIHLTAVVTQVTSLDFPPPGPSQGDELIVAGNVLQNGTKVGTYDETCTTTRTGTDDSSTVQCVTTLTLPQGKITVQGVFAITNTGPGDITLAITGGTGVYRTAQGYVQAVNTSSTETQIALHLSR